MTVPYQQYSRPNSSRPIVDKLLASPKWRGEFENTLKTVIKRFFKPSVIGPRLEAWTHMLQEDINWDRGLQAHSPGQASNWTAADFTAGMNSTTKGQVGILEFVTKRSQSVCQQLQFQDNDDLPALSAYTQGRYMDAQGQVSDHPNGNNGGNVVSPNSGDSSSASSIISIPNMFATFVATISSFIYFNLI